MDGQQPANSDQPVAVDRPTESDEPADANEANAAELPAVDPAIFDATPKTQLRLLTQLEYRNTVSFLMGVEWADVEALSLPDDLLVAGFGSVGAALWIPNDAAVQQYETASQVLAQMVFADEERWQAFVGCIPQPDLGDACVEDYVRRFGRRAFRRDLTEEEVTQWTEVARNAAAASDEPSAVSGLATFTSGLLQSPNFLYRVEHAVPDLELGRIKFDSPSMATRVAYLASATTPDDALLDAAAAGELNTPQQIRTAFEERLASPAAIAHMPEFFTELAQLRRTLTLAKSLELFPELDDELRASMLEETQRWLANEVLAPKADVRSFFNSTTTFVDARLAEFYGVPEPSEPFEAVNLGPETDRSGILGKAAFLFVQSSSDRSNLVRRGYYIRKYLLCDPPPPPPAGLTVSVPEPVVDDGPKTTRQLMEQHLNDAMCIACHAGIDPLGYALEHFDAIGQYRETENGLPIDATGEFRGYSFDGAVELGQVLHDLPSMPTCLVTNFYRYANGIADETPDLAQIAALAATLTDVGYVWRNYLVDFATSDAFTSLPASVE